MVAKSGRGWQLAPSLVDLIGEIDARWPKRSRSADGSIGDDAHAARASEHNPDRDPDPMPTGYVSALDVTKDSAEQMETLRKALIADPRTWYVIHRRTIWSRTNGFAPRSYWGTNPHLSHMHVSLMQTGAGAKPGPWGLVKPADKPRPKHETVRVSRILDEIGGRKPAPRQTKRVQRALIAEGLLPKGSADGVFGPKTRAAYSAWQRKLDLRGPAADGIPGPGSLGELGKRRGFRVIAD